MNEDTPTYAPQAAEYQRGVEHGKALAVADAEEKERRAYELGYRNGFQASEREHHEREKQALEETLAAKETTAALTRSNEEKGDEQ